MKRRRRTRRTRLGSTAGRFSTEATMAARPPRAPTSPAAAEEAIALFRKAQTAATCVVALSHYGEGSRQLGQLVARIDDGGKGTLMQNKDALMRAADASRRAQQAIAARCFCNR